MRKSANPAAPTQERLRELLSYNHETGDFHWKSSGGRKNPLRVAGCIRQNGYRTIGVDGYHHVAHRLAWLYHYNAWPIADVDHINGDGFDNRISNLRLASRSQNKANTPARSTSKSGVKGVCWRPQTNRWRATITVNGKQRSLGSYDTLIDASEAYRIASEHAFGSFSYHKREEAYGNEESEAHDQARRKRQGRHAQAQGQEVRA